MKKTTLKKTGVAVLSMALLLSMGAMAMPVNAAAGDAKTLLIPPVTCGTEKVNVTDASVYLVAQEDADTGAWAWVGEFTNNMQVTALNQMDAAELNAFARQLKKKAADADPVSATPANNANALEYALDIQGKGYYLVIPAVADNSIAIQPSLVLIDATGTAKTQLQAKANPLPLEKKITATTAGQVSSTGDTSVGIVGSTVEYKITSYLPDYAADVTNVKPYVLTDDPSEGIKINNDDFTAAGSNVVVKINGTTDTTATVAKANDGFTVTVPSATVIAHKGESIEVTFKATIDTDAVMGSQKCSDADAKHAGQTGNPNTVKLTWGNNYATGEYAYPTDHTPEPNEPDVPEEPKVEKKDTVTTYAGKVTLLKQGDKDGDQQMETLEGAEFTLTGPAAYGTKRGLATNANGVIDFGYLPAGEYTLTETKAPSGYKTIGSNYKFTVTNNNAGGSEFDTFAVAPEMKTVNTSMVPVEVEGVDLTLTESSAVAVVTVTDPPADTLPATGGIGTYVFTFGGTAIVLLAGVLFVVYMKKRKIEE